MTTGRWEADPALVGVDGSEEGDPGYPMGRSRGGAAGDRPAHRPRLAVAALPRAAGRLATSTSRRRVCGHRRRGSCPELSAVAEETAPGIGIETTLTVGEPSAELVRRAPGAQLVVVGNRGLGGFTGLLLGSTGSPVCAARHARWLSSEERGSAGSGGRGELAARPARMKSMRPGVP